MDLYGDYESSEEVVGDCMKMRENAQRLQELRVLRKKYSRLLAMVDDGEERTVEVRQLCIDVMDAVEQSPDEIPLVAAVAAYDKLLNGEVSPRAGELWRSRYGDGTVLTVTEVTDLVVRYRREGWETIFVEGLTTWHAGYEQTPKVVL